MPPLGPVAVPTMYRVRQAFPRPRLEDIPAGVRQALAGARLPIRRGDTVAVGAGSRGIANVDDPRILWIAALDLTDESHGNATGVGNADFTTRRLAEKIDWKPTAINTLTACAPNGAKLPLVFETDREAVESALGCIGLTPSERARLIRIRSTLVLGEIECSEALLPEIAKRPDLTLVGEGRPLGFDPTGRIVPLRGH